MLTAGIYDLLEEISIDNVSELLGYLGPESVMIDIVAPEFEPKATTTEKWFGIKYYYEDNYEI